MEFKLQLVPFHTLTGDRLKWAQPGIRAQLAASSRHDWHAGKRAATLWRQASRPASERGFQPRDPFAGMRGSPDAPDQSLNSNFFIPNPFRR